MYTHNFEHISKMCEHRCSTQGTSLCVFLPSKKELFLSHFRCMFEGKNAYQATMQRGSSVSEQLKLTLHLRRCKVISPTTPFPQRHNSLSWRLAFFSETSLKQPQLLPFQNSFWSFASSFLALTLSLFFLSSAPKCWNSTLLSSESDIFVCHYRNLNK